MGGAEEVARRYFSAIELNDVEGALATLSDDVEFWTPGGGFTGIGPARGFVESYITGFPSATFEITSVVEAPDRVAVEGHYKGTNTGAMMTPDGRQMPATGKSVDIPFITVFGFDGEKLTSHHAYWDQVSFGQQLGLGG
jgi:steroid delta-isomerase-like uncharacterized protein